MAMKKNGYENGSSANAIQAMPAHIPFLTLSIKRLFLFFSLYIMKSLNL